jgi:DNA topoisomerase III
LKKEFTRKYLKIVDQKKKAKVYPKPRPMGTEELLTIASERLEWDSNKVMRAAEDLYTNGLCSYPRVDANDYGEDFDASSHLERFLDRKIYRRRAHRVIGNLTSYEEQLNNDVESEEDFEDDSDDKFDKISQDQEEILKELSEHCSIVPMPMFSSKRKHLENLKKNDAIKLHKMIVSYFFATLSNNAKIDEVTTTYKIGEHQFESRHHEINDLGFMEHFDLFARTKRMLKIQPKNILNKEIFEIVGYHFQKRETAPPEYLSESELISLMKKNRIGTNGTISDHIKKIKNQGYVVAKKDKFMKRLIPTKLGKAMARAFLSIDSRLIKPDVRKFIEENCLRISNEKLSHQKVLNDAIEAFEGKMDHFDVEKFIYHLEDSGLQRVIVNTEVDISWFNREEFRIIPGEDYLLEELTVASTNFVDSDDENEKQNLLGESVSPEDVFKVEDNAN